MVADRVPNRPVPREVTSPQVTFRPVENLAAEKENLLNLSVRAFMRNGEGNERLVRVLDGILNSKVDFVVGAFDEQNNLIGFMGFRNAQVHLEDDQNLSVLHSSIIAIDPDLQLNDYGIAAGLLRETIALMIRGEYDIVVGATQHPALISAIQQVSRNILAVYPINTPAINVRGYTPQSLLPKIVAQVFEEDLFLATDEEGNPTGGLRNFYKGLNSDESGKLGTSTPDPNPEVEDVFARLGIVPENGDATILVAYR